MATFYAGQTDYINILNSLATANELADISASTAAAAASATAAANSASTATAQAGTATTQAGIATTAATNATTAKNAATAAQIAAAASQTAAANSATTAGTSATNAAASQTAAANSATTAGTHATNAAASQTAAANSATTAGTHATNAAASATAASNSASTATTQASNAAASATAASNSASTATTQASNAAASATAASNSASTATTQASNAAASATAASNSASTATTQASNAATSATAASNSASTATTQASNAAASATAAANSATSAGGYLTPATGTSTTSVLMGTGSKSFTIETGKLFAVGHPVKVVRTSAPTTTQMYGTITSYTSGTGALVLNIDSIVGSGTFTDWTITITSSINLTSPGPIGSSTPSTGAFTTLSSSGNATLGDSTSLDSHTVNGALTVLANTAGAALTITQTGAGNTLVLNDATSTIVVGNTTRYTHGQSVTPQIQLNLVTAGYYGVSRWSADGAAGGVSFAKSRGATVGTRGTVLTGDDLGVVMFNGDDGTNFITAAQIVGEVDGTPGLNDMPGRLLFSTTADGASTPTERYRIASDGKHTKTGYVQIDSSGSSAALTVTNTGSGHSLLVEDSTSVDATPFVVTNTGVVGIGTSNPSATGVGVTAGLSLESASAFAPTVAISNTTTDANPSSILFYKQRSGAIVNSGDAVALIRGYGFDGTTNRGAADIRIDIDGTPGLNDMPGRLVFSTTADGASSPTERMRITSAGDVLVGTGTADGTGVATMYLDAATKSAFRLRNSTSGASGYVGAFNPNEWRVWTSSSTDLTLGTNGAERMRIDSAGNWCNNGAATAGVSVDLSRQLTGAASGFTVSARINPDVTVSSAATGFTTFAINGVGTSTASFTHYSANQGTFSGTAPTNQYGFFAQVSLTGATNNYGFYGGIAAGTNRYNFYAAGTAANYFGGVTTFAKAVVETKTAPTISGGTLTLDLSSGALFAVSLNAAITTLTLSNPPASNSLASFVLEFTADGTSRAVTWPASVKWAGGTAPTLTSANAKKDAFVFYTYDGGTTYIASIIGQNF